MKLTAAAYVRKNLRGRPLRTLLVFAGVAAAAFFLFLSLFLWLGIRDGARRWAGRLGADLMVVPKGAEADARELLLSGSPRDLNLDRALGAQVRALPGVARLNAHRYFRTLRACCCSLPDLLIVGYEPADDFMVRPWVSRSFLHALIARWSAPPPPAEADELASAGVYFGHALGALDKRTWLNIYGQRMVAEAVLDPSGLGFDRAVFVPMPTLRTLAERSPEKAVAPLILREDRVSALFVKLAPGVRAPAVIAQIRQLAPDVAVLQPGALQKNLTEEYELLVRYAQLSMLAMLLFMLGALALHALHAAYERRQELFFLQTLGAGRGFLMGTLTAEFLLPALAGWLAGLGLVLLCGKLLYAALVLQRHVSFLLPSAREVLPGALAILLILLAATAAAHLLFLRRLLRQDAVAGAKGGTL